MPKTSEDAALAAVAFGRRVRDRRIARGLPLRWIAREAGISTGYLCELERGLAVPGAPVLERLADVMGTTMDGLWRGLE